MLPYVPIVVVFECGVLEALQVKDKLSKLIRPQAPIQPNNRLIPA